MARQYHVALDDGEVAPTVLLPGDPGRVEVVARLWDEAQHVATNREYVTWTGTYKGTPISCTSTGIGAPSTSIALEELARVGATTFIRIGTCGTFLDHVAVGDMAVFDSAIRLDGASASYAPIEFPAVASHDVVSACIRAGDELGYRYHVGTTRSADTFLRAPSATRLVVRRLLAIGVLRPGARLGAACRRDLGRAGQRVARLR
jgi:uridine phosphorylase